MGQCCQRDPLDYYELEDQSESSKKLSLCILTWNVGGKNPSDDIAPLLKLDGITQHQPDIYVIGLQDTATNSQRLIGSKNKKMNKWESKIEEILNNTDNNSIIKHKYVKLESLRLFGMLSLVLVSNHKKELFSQTSNGISNIITSKVGTGLLNNIGNKGAVGVHFSLFDKTFNFVNVHFTGHQGNNALKSQKEDYDKLMTKMRPFDKNDDSSDNPQSPSQSPSQSQQQPPIILDNGDNNPNNNDIIFVFGDFNYRSNVNLENMRAYVDDGSDNNNNSNDNNNNNNERKDFVEEFNQIITYMNANQYVKLAKIDQLGFEMKCKNVFIGFDEQRLRFPPTYKYKAGTIDTLNDKKLPSYCDRILWKVSNTIARENKIHVKCHKYISSMTQVLSDHKPVVALFTIDY